MLFRMCVTFKYAHSVKPVVFVITSNIPHLQLADTFAMWVCSSSIFSFIPHLHRSFVIQCLIMACPCVLPSSAPLGSLIFTYCFSCFLGRRDDIVQTSPRPCSLPASPSLLLILSLPSHSSSSFSQFLALFLWSHAAAVQ